MAENPNTREFWNQQYTIHSNQPDRGYARLKNHHKLWNTVVTHVCSHPLWGNGTPRVLDVGCGVGVLAYLLDEENGSEEDLEFNYLGLDFSARAEEGFRQFYTDEFQGWEDGSRRFACEPITPASIRDLALMFQPTIICCIETLEHLSDDIEVCKALRRAVPMGGRIVVSVPSRPGVRYHLRHYGRDYVVRIDKSLRPYACGQTEWIGNSWIVGVYDY